VTDGLDAVDEQLIARLTGKAREGGMALTGEGGLLAQLTRRLVESALDGELTDHLGYDKHDVTGRDGGNSRNGHRSKTVLTEVGPVEIDVPRDREGSFEPKIVAKRQRRLSGVDELVISLSAKGLTTGEVQAHLAEVYGAQVSRQTISTITDKVVEGMAEWQNRPLDPVYPVIFIDAIIDGLRCALPDVHREVARAALAVVFGSEGVFDRIRDIRLWPVLAGGAPLRV
jgi:transposase-like protein